MFMASYDFTGDPDALLGRVRPAAGRVPAGRG